MTNYKTPGVYIEEKPLFPPSIAAVETAIPAFIGYTEKAMRRGESIVNVPTKISSILEYEDFFGGAQLEQNIVVKIIESRPGRPEFTADFDFENTTGPSQHVMYYAMQQFFANGGGPCYIISVGPFLAHGTPLSNEEVFTDALAELRKFDQPTLIVIPEAQKMTPGAYKNVLSASIKQCKELGDRFAIIDLQSTGIGLNTTADFDDVAETFRNNLDGEPDLLRYGAAYFPNIRSTFNYNFNRTSFTGITIRRGATELTFADLTGSERANAVAALDEMDIYLPPSASVAGIYARVDNSRGVWKAPANESVMNVSRLTCNMNDAIQMGFNVDDNAGRSINVIRSFVGRGIKVWGARTLDGNSNEWRYVSVRRFFNMVEESAKKATFQFVFEPNDKNTWTRVRSMIENFLFLQWRAGALMGTTPEQAYFVKVGFPETMTELDIWEGRMIVKIGMAVVRPAEFIILEFSHKMLSES